MFVCKICGNEVKTGQAFCPTCGADVVENYQTVCPVCNAKNGAGSKYCAKCGGILPVMRKPVCAVCGAKNLPGAKFCVSCGAPIAVENETHSDKDMLEARKAKAKLDAMERERMSAVDKEIADKRAKIEDEKEQAMEEVEQYRKSSEEEYAQKAEYLAKYREKLNELGGEDVALLQKMSTALKSYSKYYADPYSQIDEDEIEGDTYVCPACGTINPITATHCAHCGRNKARALLLLAKNKIKQSPPVKRKQIIIPAPEVDLEVKKTPTLDEFIDELNAPKYEEMTIDEVVEEEKAEEKVEEKKEEKKEEQADFSGPCKMPYPPCGYPYPYAPYPYPPYQQGVQPSATMQSPQQASTPAYLVGEDGKPYQMPPIIQPIAFVPYVTQEQPLMQYAPQEQPAPAAQPVAPSASVVPTAPVAQQPQDEKRAKRKK